MSVLGERPPSEPAPRADRSRPELLAHSAEGLSFPDWGEAFGWRAVGARTDELGGRRASTVAYGRGRLRLAYTIVSGPPLRAPAGGERRIRRGVELHLTPTEGRPAVSWQRGGRTCVLSGVGVSPRTLIRLASWDGGGAVRF